MRCTKSNGSSTSILKRTAIYGLWNLWKQDIGWNRKTRKEKKIIAWFILSFIVMVFVFSSFLFIPAFINSLLAYNAMNRNNVEVEE